METKLGNGEKTRLKREGPVSDINSFVLQELTAYSHHMKLIPNVRQGATA